MRWQGKLGCWVFWGGHATWHVGSSSQSGIELVTPAVGALNASHLTTREIPGELCFKYSQLDLKTNKNQSLQSPFIADLI